MGKPKSAGIKNFNALIRVSIRTKTLYASRDSDLEAFSRNLTHGSFGAMAFQPAPFTNYANKVFLSY